MKMKSVLFASVAVLFTAGSVSAADLTNPFGLPEQAAARPLLSSQARLYSPTRTPVHTRHHYMPLNAPGFRAMRHAPAFHPVYRPALVLQAKIRAAGAAAPAPHLPRRPITTQPLILLHSFLSYRAIHAVQLQNRISLAYTIL